jgi:hypothetical protein
MPGRRACHRWPTPANGRRASASCGPGMASRQHGQYGQAQVMHPPVVQSTGRSGLGAQSDPICAPQPVIAEESPAAQNRRISRDSRDQRLSPCITGLPKRERPDRLFASLRVRASGRQQAQIGRICIPRAGSDDMLGAAPIGGYPRGDRSPGFYHGACSSPKSASDLIADSEPLRAGSAVDVRTRRSAGSGHA